MNEPSGLWRHHTFKTDLGSAISSATAPLEVFFREIFSTVSPSRRSRRCVISEGICSGRNWGRRRNVQSDLTSLDLTWRRAYIAAKYCLSKTGAPSKNDYDLVVSFSTRTQVYSIDLQGSARRRLSETSSRGVGDDLRLSGPLLLNAYLVGATFHIHADKMHYAVIRSRRARGKTP